MKYLIPLLFVAVFVVSCGPSKEEIARQKRIDDSLLEIQRNSALDNANKLLDSTFSDTVDSSKTTVKK